ncbi:hypothetical protein K0B96_16210 [Horticoccus luteus]|uniref:SMP domain-containing protein n=2 Tax=Horticoccus luteus TaxID=2862869 RepID=A0A8F9TTL6_9BACT|nr:hypothetical protein K0B96_16210 [Horticoccus luteus]
MCIDTIHPIESTMKNSASQSVRSTPMNQSDAARIQSATARVNQGTVSSGSFAARAQSAAAKAAPARGTGGATPSSR